MLVDYDTNTELIQSIGVPKLFGIRESERCDAGNVRAGHRSALHVAV